jgi:hypothetical protein
MCLDVPPLATSLDGSPVDRPSRLPGRTEESFSDAVSRASSARIPDEVWEQVDAAARLAEELHTQGRGVRFDVHELDGGVLAGLVDADGALLRPLALEDVIDVDRLAHELAQERSEEQP